MKKLALHWQIMIGLVIGIIWAFLSSYIGLNEFTQDWINPFGTIFIRMLKFIAVPLVMFSIISGISSLPDASSLGRLGAKTIIAYIITTVVAITVGLTLVNSIGPGKLVDEDTRIRNRLSYELWVKNEKKAEILDGKDLLNDPKYQEMAREMDLKGSKEVSAVDISEQVESAEQQKDQGPLQPLVEMVPENIVKATGSNSLMLQVIFFAIFFGICMLAIPQEKIQPVKTFIDGTVEVFLKMVEYIMKGAPFFVFALMAGVISEMADTPAQVFEIFKGLGTYAITVVAGLAFMVFVFYPLIIHLFVRKLKYPDYLRRISPAQALAFSTSSSAATLPVTMECVEDRLGASPNITSFVLPIGATVNMDGTSLYQAIAVIFLAQLHMVDLTLAQQLTIVLTATLASIGSAAVPSAGLVMLIIVLQSVQLNPLWIAIVFPVDRILDMCRTVVNVTGDTCVTSIIANSEGQLNVPQTIEE